MSIFKDTFRDYVKFQLGVRDEIVSIGNPNLEGPIATGVTLSDGTSIDLRDDPASVDRRIYAGYGASRIRIKIGNSTKEVNIPNGGFFSLLNRQAVIRMTSLVDYVDDVNLEIGDLQAEIAGAGVGFERLKGAALSQNFILEGGVLSNFARNLDRDNDGNLETILRRVDQPRRSFPRPNQKSNLGYGDFAIGADATSDGYGIVPMPGITQANIRTKSAYGSLREARVEFVCHNRRQLEVLEMLYMRPGYVSLLEWGWSPFINNDGDFINQFKYIENFTNGKIYSTAITQAEIYNAINRLKEDSAGNYDGLLGFVKNFGFNARPDGGYDCYTELISMGEVIDSLKIPNRSLFKTELNDTNSSRQFNPLSSINGRLATGELTAAEYADATTNLITLESNGLLGLVQSLYNASKFNTNVINNMGDTNLQYDEDEYQEIFALYNKQYGFDPTDTVRNRDTEFLYGGAERTGYGNSIKAYLVDLVRFQSDSVLTDLVFKLGIDPSKLNSFFIKKEIVRTNTGETGSQRDGTNTNTYSAARNTSETYIRWDALCILINDMLIPKDEKNYNTFNIIPDRVYDLDNKTSRIDPLTYCAITAFKDGGTSNPISDFSCDSNICILPNQFEIEGTGIEANLGYKPDLSLFPVSYLLGIYNKDSSQKIIYNNSEITRDINLVTLNDEDKLRRIGSIFLNLKMLLNLAEQNQNNDNYTLGRFLTDIWDKVNEACPNHNFVLVDDKESNSMFVIDLPVDNTKVPSYDDLYQFIPFSNKNTLREFSYESLVPSALSSTIAIQAQDPRSITDIDGVTFAAFNKSIKNRLFSADITPNWKKIREDLDNRRAELANRIFSSEEILRIFAVNFFRNLKLEANNEDIIGNDNVVGILKGYQIDNAYLQTSFNNTSTFNSVIPLNFNLKMDGISGIVIGNIFKIKKDRLPKAYTKTNVGFIVFNESQTITAGQDWTTDLSGKLIIMPDERYNVQNNIIFSTSRTAFNENQTTRTNVEDTTTTVIDETQTRVTDIDQVQPGEPVFLKRVKVNGLRGPDGGLLQNVGYAFVRNTPGVNNEDPSRWDIFEKDNAIGAFDSWNNGGLELGIVKDIQQVYYSNNQRSIYPEYYSLYGINNPVFQTRIFLFTPSTELVNEETGEIYYKSQNGVEILKKHTNNVESVWYNIVFNEAASNLFLNGFVLNDSALIGANIDPTGADFQLPPGTTLKAYSEGTGNAWMHYRTLAGTAISARDLNSNNIIDADE